MRYSFGWKDRLPIVKWLPQYSFHSLQCDFIAGITVALMVIPQALAYAVIAGLPPQYGLYSAFMGGFVYCLLGSCKDLAVGPAAIMALMAGAFGQKDDPNFAVTLSLSCGVVLLFMGVLSLGFIVRLIPLPVVSGFTSAAAFIIAGEQLPNLLGLTVDSDVFYKLIYDTFSNIKKTRVADLTLGVICMVLLEILRNFNRIHWPPETEYPPSVVQRVSRKIIWVMEIGRNAVIVFAATLIAIALHSKDSQPFSLTGPVQEGLPAFEVPKLKSNEHNSTISTAQMFSDIGAGFVVVPMIAFLTSIAIAQSFSRKNHYNIDPSQELIALGVANVLNAFVSGFPIAGCFSRTTVNSLSGVATPFGVHIKDLRVLKVQQRSFDKKYEYVFEVTWSNGKVINVHRAYGELFDFQCKLRRCHSKDGCKVPGKRLIPYLPPRKPIKFCKGTDILPDISNYVREFAQLPDKILHSERVEHFFSDGNEKASETSSQHQIPKSKLNPNQEQKETPPSRPATETARVNEEIKPGKGNGLPKKHSPKGKSSSTIFCKKPTSSLQTALKLGAKKLDIIGQKDNGPEAMTSSKGGVKGKTVNHPLEVKISRHLQEEQGGNHPGVNRSPKVVTAEHSSEGPATNKLPETRNHLSPAAAEEVKAVNHSPTVATLNQQPQVVISSSRPEGKTIDHSPQVKLTNHSTEVKITKNARNVNLKSSSSSSHSIQSPTKKSRVFKNHRKENLFVTNGDIRRTDDVNTSVSVTTHPPKDSVAMNGHTHRPYLGKMPPNQGDHTELDETCAVTSQVTSEMKSRTPLTVAVPVPSPVCSKCLTFSPFLSDSSPTSSLSTSPLDSPLSLGPSQLLALSLSPDQRHFNSVMTKCTPERVKLCQRQKHERFKDSNDEESLNHCSTNINKIEAKETEKEKLKASSSSLKSGANPTRNGFNLGHSVRPNTSQRGLLIVPNGYSQYSLNQDGPDQQEYSVPSSYNELTCYDCHTNFDTRTNSLDSNCNYIIHNGNHPNTSDLKSNKTHENKHKVLLLIASY